MNKLILAAMAACSLAGMAHAATKPQAVADKQVSIPFVDYGGVQDWRVTKNDHALLLRGTGSNYYKATFLGSCPNLGFNMRIGIPGGALDSLDKFSTIYVGHEACPLKSLTRIDQATWNAAS